MIKGLCPSVALAIACKNEGDTLEAVIQSAMPLLDQNPESEIVISIDDKTTDNTEEIARRYTDKVHFHTWKNDFSAMRNGLIEKCSAEWILNLDGHEILMPGSAESIARYLRIGLENVDGYGIFLVIRPDESGVPKEFNFQIKVFRNDPKIHFEDKVHNRLVGIGSDHGNLRALTRDEALILHKRPVELEEERRKQRDEMLPEEMMARIAEDPGDTRALWYLMKHHIGMAWNYQPSGDVFVDFKHWKGHIDKALDFGERHLKYSRWDNERSAAIYDMGAVTMELVERIRRYAPVAETLPRDMVRMMLQRPNITGNLTKLLYDRAAMLERRADGMFWDAFRERYDRRENLLALGEMYSQRKDWHRAEHFFTMALNAPEPMITGSIHPGPAYSYQPLSALANVYVKSGNLAKAVEFGKRALQHKPNDKNLQRQVAIAQETLNRRYDLPLTPGGKPRLLIIDKLGQFTKALIDEWAQDFEIRLSNRIDVRELRWAQVVFQEWADENAIELSRLPDTTTTRIVRLHGYETLERDFVGRITWENIDALVCPADSVLEAAHRRFGIYQRVDCNVIRNGLRLRDWTYKERSPGNHIAWIGFFNEKKNLPLLMQAAMALPEYHFHLTGQWQSTRLREYLTSHRLHNIFIQGWTRDIDGWLEDKNYLISTSMFEGPGMNILEAMAKGICPLIHRWVGVDECYPEFGHLTWSEVRTLKYHLDHMAEHGMYQSAKYREFVEEKHDVRDQARAIKELMIRCVERRIAA